MDRHLGSDTLPKTELVSYLQHNGDVHFLRRWKLTGAAKNIRKTRNCSQLIAAYKVSVGKSCLSSGCHDSSGFRALNSSSGG